MDAVWTTNPVHRQPGFILELSHGSPQPDTPTDLHKERESTVSTGPITTPVLHLENFSSKQDVWTKLGSLDHPAGLRNRTRTAQRRSRTDGMGGIGMERSPAFRFCCTATGPEVDKVAAPSAIDEYRRRNRPSRRAGLPATLSARPGPAPCSESAGDVPPAAATHPVRDDPADTGSPCSRRTRAGHHMSRFARSRPGSYSPHDSCHRQNSPTRSLRSCPQPCHGITVDRKANRGFGNCPQPSTPRSCVDGMPCAGLARRGHEDVSSTRRGGGSGATWRSTVSGSRCARILRRSGTPAAAATPPRGRLGAAGRYGGSNGHRSTLNGRGHLGRWTLQA